MNALPVADVVVEAGSCGSPRAAVTSQPYQASPVCDGAARSPQPPKTGGGAACRQTLTCHPAKCCSCWLASGIRSPAGRRRAGPGARARLRPPESRLRTPLLLGGLRPRGGRQGVPGRRTMTSGEPGDKRRLADASHPDRHRLGRPSWDCAGCGDAWPCGTVRGHLLCAYGPATDELRFRCVCPEPECLRRQGRSPSAGPAATPRPLRGRRR
jgi:hypothetical protein